MNDAPLKRTPLYGVHKALGARMIPFAGWEMPVQYTSLLAEHRTVRSAVGLFDLSHMGEFYFDGPDAQDNLQRLLTNDVTALAPGKAHYTLILNERGGVVDDVILYRLDERRYMLVVNAANIQKDRDWLRRNLRGRVTLDDQSEETALIAIQGPRSEEVVGSLVEEDLGSMTSFTAVVSRIAGQSVLLSRTGYTGEDGFEVYCRNNEAAPVWEALMEAGRDAGIVPVGLGARDTLRLEARLPLYGNDLSDETSPIEAGLAFAVKLEKGEFVGREALLNQKESGPKRKLVGFEMLERGVPRHGYPILADGRVIGEVTSGSFSPSLEKDIGMGYVPSEMSAPGASIEIDIRGKARSARIVKGRFVPARTKRG